MRAFDSVKRPHCRAFSLMFMKTLFLLLFFQRLFRCGFFWSPAFSHPQSTAHMLSCASRQIYQKSLWPLRSFISSTSNSCLLTTLFDLLPTLPSAGLTTGLNLIADHVSSIEIRETPSNPALVTASQPLSRLRSTYA